MSKSKLPPCNGGLNPYKSECDAAPLQAIEVIGFNEPAKGTLQLSHIPVAKMDPALVADLKKHGILPIMADNMYANGGDYYTDGHGNYFGLASPERIALEEAAKLL